MARVLMTRVLLAAAVVGVALSSARPIRADDAEDKAVAFVEKLGGVVTRDDKLPGKPVVKVNLADTNVTDAGLKELAPLKNLTILYLNETKVTDAGLKELAPLKNLTWLNLRDTQVTDTGLKELQQALPKCKILASKAK
jgi:internalin A